MEALTLRWMWLHLWLTGTLLMKAQADISDCDLQLWGNGYCDEQNNVQDCSYDLGDCCICDCFNQKGLAGYDCGSNGYNCVNPVSRCAPFDDDADCIWLWMHDGSCDEYNDNSECGWDAGDCNGGFPCDDDKMGDGNCDSVNNNYYCQLDGFDCSTLDSADEPSADDSSADDSSVDDPSVDDSDECDHWACGIAPDCDWDTVGDGNCDSVNDAYVCEYDGGDCDPSDSADNPIVDDSSADNPIVDDPSGEDTARAVTAGDSSSDSGSNVGGTVGGVIGGLVFLACAAVLVVRWKTGRLQDGKCSGGPGGCLPCCIRSEPAVVTGTEQPAASAPVAATVNDESVTGAPSAST